MHNWIRCQESLPTALSVSGILTQPPAPACATLTCGHCLAAKHFFMWGIIGNVPFWRSVYSNTGTWRCFRVLEFHWIWGEQLCAVCILLWLHWSPKRWSTGCQNHEWLPCGWTFGVNPQPSHFSSIFWASYPDEQLPSSMSQRQALPRIKQKCTCTAN